jgi:hypothetical protein
MFSEDSRELASAGSSLSFVLTAPPLHVVTSATSVRHANPVTNWGFRIKALRVFVNSVKSYSAPHDNSFVMIRFEVECGAAVRA